MVVYYIQRAVYKIIWWYSSGSSIVCDSYNQSASIAGQRRVKKYTTREQKKKKIVLPIVRYWLDGLTKTHINILYRQQYIDTRWYYYYYFSTASATVNRPADKGVVCRSAATVADRDEGFGEGRRSMVFYATTDPTGHHLRERVDRRHLYTFCSCNNIIRMFVYLHIYYNMYCSDGASALCIHFIYT